MDWPRFCCKLGKHELPEGGLEIFQIILSFLFVSCLIVVLTLIYFLARDTDGSFSDVGRFSRAMETAIPTLVDQQLVFESALLTAAVAQPCMFTIFQLQLITELAILSNIIPLLLIAVFPHHFGKRNCFNKLRVGSTVLGLALVVSISQRAYGIIKSQYRPAQCDWIVLIISGACKYTAMFQAGLQRVERPKHIGAFRFWLDWSIWNLHLMSIFHVLPFVLVNGLVRGTHILGLTTYEHPQFTENEWSFECAILLIFLVIPIAFGIKGMWFVDRPCHKVSLS
jgi:hypothetical protein